MDTVKVRALSAFKGLASERGKEAHVKKDQVIEVSRTRAIDLKAAGLVEDASATEARKPADADTKGAPK
ncbi:hypothetical protein [Deinococcus humi]|uniref:Uncharacterized protein n=1 Tax=Deinococcus humi TaxID=662880 RepID=A0A7W8NGL4_9DEIO|nr:hypothetical protein [Deinococcus humi]MBB5363092.1 hypothetical protein [Deinococcus humi]GGO24725.1 hypothetical protein GCM10008949_13940 [Deinococcus humi]